MKDMIAVGALVFAFALLVTAHVALVWGLAFRPPRWRALVALVVPFAGAMWGWRAKMRVRATVWTLALGVYAVAYLLAR